MGNYYSGFVTFHVNPHVFRKLFKQTNVAVFKAVQVLFLSMCYNWIILVRYMGHFNHDSLLGRRLGMCNSGGGGGGR